MNQRTTYEITIAEKLRELNAPGMREAIWTRIEAQLDLDLPNDDTPSKPEGPKAPDWTSFTKGFGFFAVVVAVVTVFFISKKQDRPSINKDNAPASIEQILPAPGNNESPPPDQSIQQPVTNNSQTPDQTPAAASDSFINAPVIPTAGTPLNTVTDTPVAAPFKAPPPEIIPPIRQDTVPKKSKGFKGITDSDYKISLKKDSTP